MDAIYAARLAAWVEDHDDGTPAPRTTIYTGQMSNSCYIEIRSMEYSADGTSRVITEQAHSYADARKILGY